ncbi:hypothetical protein [Achromobacter ruhlandii]|uniref:ABC transporter ATP-binding protein n=1 Tax=Achromobacter ruhlandii TaxID=72557 RepID=UPI003D24BBC8
MADGWSSGLGALGGGEVLELSGDLTDGHGFAGLLISQALGVVVQVADRVVVMRDGGIVEQGTRDTVFDQPREEYTRSLLSAIPALESTETGGVRLRWRLDQPEPSRATA